MTVVFAIGFLFSVDVRLTLCSLSIIPLFYLPARVVAKKIRAITEEALNVFGKLSAYMTEVFIFFFCFFPLFFFGFLFLFFFGGKKNFGFVWRSFFFCCFFSFFLSLIC